MKNIMIVGLPAQKLAAMALPQDAEYIVVSDDKDLIHEKVPGINALLGCPRHAFSDELLKRAGPSLQWVHSGGAGIEDFLTPGLVEGNIIMTNGKILQGPEIADHAFGLLLSLTRNISALIKGESQQSLPRPIELRGKTMLVIGTGGIGILIAERAKAFGMKVFGLDDDYVAMLSCFDKQFFVDQLHEALAQADVVIMAAPHTRNSERMLGQKEFTAMKQSAYFINVSRGKLVDTQALVGALESGHLGGAGLDVTDPEPLLPEHPFKKMRNVVLTPHIAGLSDHNRERSFALMKQNIDRFVRGLPLYNVVDKRRGY